MFKFLLIREMQVKTKMNNQIQFYIEENSKNLKPKSDNTKYWWEREAQ